jgi:hypothetical protein
VGLWAALELFLPSAGQYPYSWWSLLAAGGTSACGIVLARHARSASLLVAFFGLWLASCIVLYVLPSPMGETVTRLRYVVFPLMLLTVLLGGTRPRWLAVIALAGAATYNVVPYVVGLVERAGGDGTASEESYWRPTIDFLRGHESPNYLVEVVATGAHWESYYLPKEGIPVVRGWLRQTDIARNNVLYERSARPADYLQWLHAHAVRYVVLPDVRLDPYTGQRERRLVHGAAPGLVPVQRAGHVTIYEVARPTPLMTGPGRARITALTHDRVQGVVTAPGTYALRLAWSPYWRVKDGSMTLHKDPAGHVVADVHQPGQFTIDVEAPSPF